MPRRSVFAARAVVRTALLLVLAAIIAACQLMEAAPSPSPSRRVATTAQPTAADTLEPTDEVPTERPVPSGEVDLIGAADALGDLDSYRVSVASRGLVPSSAADGRVTMTSTLIQGDHPAAAFTLNGLDGFEGLGTGPIQVIVIGDEAWLKSGNGRWTRSPGGAADFDAVFTTLSPSELVSGFEGLAPAFVKVGPEMKNGQASTHERAEASNPAAADAGVTEGSIDVWVSRAGGRLVAVEADLTMDVDGVATPVLLTIEVTHVNDPANRIRPPA
jgi:hypothetical protein